ncbi:MAG TPA: glycosyltransferase, partial [Rariglobus sp.]
DADHAAWDRLFTEFPLNSALVPSVSPAPLAQPADSTAMNPTASPSPAFPALPLDASAPLSRKLRICVASFDFVGPVKNGGVGTAFTSLAEAMAAAGHDVTCLYVSGQWCENLTLDHWISVYAKKGIRFVPMPATCTLRMDAAWSMIQSYQAYLWLREQAFDIVHFSEWTGPGYFALRAKKQGLAFADTLLCVHTHGPTLWHKLSNSEWVNTTDDIQRDYMEKLSVKLADVVVSPSQYLLRWMREQEWTFPAHTYVEQYVRPATARNPLPAKGDGVCHPREFVFFGRLEHRKGLVLFCDALDKLVRDPAVANFAITFLGKSVEVNGQAATAYIAERAKKWPWRHKIISDRDQAGAMDYLQGGPRLVVLPSLVDNLPNTVLECLGAALPFIASNTGGIPEMIAAEDFASACFELRPSALAAKLKHVALHGLKPPRQAGSPEATERAWVTWHENQVPALIAEAAPKPLAGDTQPLVSVCMAHWNRPHYLAQAVASIEAQDYPNMEVIVVDDCSTSPEAVAFLDELEARFKPRGWQVLRQPENRFPGAARNRAARAARGEYLMFMDDDNVAKPGEITTFVNAARRTGADVLTCFLDTFDGVHAAGPGQKINSRLLFLGDCVSAGALHNVFGDTNSLVRRQTFLDLGGFHEQWGVNHEDYEFMAKVALRGHKLEVIADALVWYRVNEGETSVLRNTPFHGNLMCSIRPFLQAVPPELRSLVLFAQGASLRQGTQAVNQAAVEKLIQQTVLWKSKLEAALQLAALGQQAVAARLMIDAIKAVQGCDNPQVIMEALLEVAPHLAKLDAG